MQTHTFENIMIIGNIGRAFVNTKEIDAMQARICPGIFDALEILSKSNYEILCVISDGFGPKLVSGLTSLKEVSPNSKIVLLVQMYEEPFAINLQSSPRHSLFQDYIVCPVTPRSLASQLQRLLHAPHARNSSDNDEAYIESEMIEHLSKLATEDDLTGLKNRRYVREFLRQLLDRAAGENIRITLLMFDIDNFKHYNDVYGHAAGDEILKQAAVLMRTSCRKHDVVARIGGDEFAVIFWDNPKDAASDERRRAQVQHPHEIFFIAERFRRAMNDTNLPALGPEGQGMLTISGGLSSYPGDGETVEELFEKADQGLLEAKRSGKNRIYLVGSPQN